MLLFELEDEDKAAPLLYPAKILALYEDTEGNLKALVHSVEYKMARGVEGPFGNSQLM
jgi:hypothetical protein